MLAKLLYPTKETRGHPFSDTSNPRTVVNKARGVE